MNFVLSSLSEGLLWSIMAIGVYLTFRILNIADMTAEGAFPLGGSSRCITDTGRGKSLACDFTCFASRYGSRSCIRNAPHQDENPSSLDRDCDLDRALFNQY